jgi:peptide/nickel transport system permease protein
MVSYTRRRLLQAIPMLLVISIICFGLLHVAPGGPLAVYADNPQVTAADLAQIKHILGLDQPAYLQYLSWLRGLVTGHWGFSYLTGRPVLDVIFERLPATLELMGSALVLTLLLALPLGIVGAVKRGTWADYAGAVIAVGGLSTPTFWLALMVVLIFGGQFHIIPTGGMQALGAPSSLADRLHHLVGPAFVLAVINIARWSRYTRSSMLEVLQQDYIRTARSKGLAWRRVLIVHAFHNALSPVITLMGLELPQLFGGAVVTETIFSWPGLGRLYFDSLNNRDYPVLMGILIITAVLVVSGNFLADIMYVYVNPRVRLQ